MDLPDRSRTPPAILVRLCSPPLQLRFPSIVFAFVLIRCQQEGRDSFAALMKSIDAEITAVTRHPAPVAMGCDTSATPLRTVPRSDRVRFFRRRPKRQIDRALSC